MPEFFIRRLREIALLAYGLVLLQSLPTGDVAKPSLGIFYYWSGLWQNWNMFAPEPAFESHRLEAQFVLTDGSKKSYIFPDHITPHHYPPPILEKFRKWSSEGLPSEEYRYTASRAIHFAARELKLPQYKRAQLIHHHQNVKTVPRLDSLNQYLSKEVLYDSQK